MLFNSIEFLFFLPLVFTVYWLILGGECKNIFYSYGQLCFLWMVGLAVPVPNGVDYIL